MRVFLSVLVRSFGFLAIGVLIPLVSASYVRAQGYYPAPSIYYLSDKGICPTNGMIVPGTGETTAGEPVEVQSGAMLIGDTFCHMPGRIPFTIGYTYRTNDATPGPMGYGTSLTTDYFLYARYGSIYELIAPGNKRFLFYPSATPNVWTNATDPEAIGATLTFPGGLGKITWKDKSVFNFAASGGLSSLQDKYGNSISIQRNSNGFATSVKDDRCNKQVTLVYDAPGGKLHYVQMWDYPGTSARRWTILGYEANPGNPGGLALAPYTGTPFAGQFKYIQDMNLVTRTFNWEVRNNQPYLKSLADPRGKIRVTNNYDAQNRVSSQWIGTSADGTYANGSYRIDYGYFDDGGGNGHTTLTYGFKDTQNITRSRTESWYFAKNHYAGYQITQYVDALGDATVYEYNDPNSRHLASAVTYHNRRTTMKYDASGNMNEVRTPRLSATDPSQLNGEMVFTATYDPTWNIPTEIAFPGKRDADNQQMTRRVQVTPNGIGDPMDVFDARGKKIHYEYTPDGRGDLLSAAVTVTDYTGATRTDTVQYQYYTSATSEGYETGKPRYIIDPTGKSTAFSYDSAQRVYQVWDRNSTTNVPHVREYRYDGMNELNQVWAWIRNDPYNDNSSWTYFTLFSILRSNTGQMQQVRFNGLESTTYYVYDDMDRLSQIQNPIGTNKFFKWTFDNKLTDYSEQQEPGIYPNSLSDRNSGRTIKNAYNPQGQLLTTTFAKTGGVSASTLTYAYDPVTRQVNSITDSDYGTQNFGYDALERLRSISGMNQSFIYTLDDAGRRTRTTFPNNGGYMGYDYDDSDNLVGVYTDNNPNFAGFAYDELNRVQFQHSVDGSTIGYKYDPRGFLNEQIVHATNGAWIYQRRYDHDNEGNVTAEYVYNALANTYKYDDFDRAIKADMNGDGGTRHYEWTYDYRGNRKTQKAWLNNAAPVTATYTYDLADRMTALSYSDGSPGAGFDYDLAGNTLQNGYNHYSWNSRGELVNVNVNAQTFTYDLFGRRERKNSGNDQYFYSWDGWNVLVDYHDNYATNPQVHEGSFMWQSPLMTDTILLRGNTIPIRNQRGDTAALMNSGASTPYAQFEYNPYGEKVKDTPSVTLNQFPYRFAGREDDGNGLYYFRNRYYSPSLGRFISQDPIGFMGGNNLYAYALNNPLNVTDPFGLDWTIGSADNPVFVFTLDGFKMGVATGAAASASAFSFGYYDGGSFKCQPGFGTSLVLATISREAAIQAATMGASGANVCLWKGCFTGDTLVLMADGSAKPISEIQYGDLVLTKSDTTGLVEAKPVVQKFAHYKDSTLLVEFEDGSTIHTTAEHPFWVNGEGWTPAGRLAIGNAIVTRAGPQADAKSAHVSAIQRSGPATVYNFLVEDSHTYFVAGDERGGGFKWVHNGGPCGIASLEEMAQAVQGALKAGAQGRRTASAIRAINNEGVEQLIFASSKKYLTQAQQAVVKSFGGIYAKGIGHAEATGIAFARDQGWRVVEAAASRAICGNCAQLIREIGAAFGSAIR